MNIILIAPPAAGKGTQSELICKKYPITHISTGDLLREKTSKNDEKSIEIKELMSKGMLISDDIILELIEEKIKDGGNFVFDGFPRNINQAISFDKLLSKLNKKIDYVIYLSIDENEAISRIVGRYVCPKCNSVYNFKSIEDVSNCLKCGEHLIKRNDDNIDVFKQRFDVYMKETFPVVAYYKEQGLLYEVDSSNLPDKVFSEIESIIGEL